MILDKTLEFADATALNIGAAGTYLLGNVVDLGVARDVGEGEQLYLVIQVDTTATSVGAATGQFKLVSDAQAAIATDGTATEHFATGAIPVANLTAGSRVCAVALPRGSYERYLGVLQITGTAAFTAGKVNAFLTDNPGKWTAYADAI